MIPKTTVAEMQPTNGDLGAEMLPSERALEMEAAERREIEERKRLRDPPIVFKDLLDIVAEFEALVGLLEGKLNETEQSNLEELRQYVLENEGSWALGDNFLNFVGELFIDRLLIIVQFEVRINNLYFILFHNSMIN